MNEQTLNLRDIHLPEPISWWPVAPGWWLLLAAVILLVAIIIFSRKVYKSRQLKRDVHAELEFIKQQYQAAGNKSQLAKSLSILLRRASISFYPATNIAGLTSEDWLTYLDNTNASKNTGFQSEIGKTLITAPYLPDNSKLDYDADALIKLCESWFLSPHKTTPGSNTL